MHSDRRRRARWRFWAFACAAAVAVLPVEWDGGSFWLKAECLQPVGAFKIRGAWHRLTDLDTAECPGGVVAVSSGNHAQGVAWAARRLGMPAAIVMPRDAPAIKLERTRELGAEVVLYDRMTEDREAIGRALSAERGAAYVHAFGDPWVIEGQGSAGVEAAQRLELGQLAFFAGPVGFVHSGAACFVLASPPAWRREMGGQPHHPSPHH